MSLRNSLQKLKEVIHAAKPPGTISPPRFPENCCLTFVDIGTANPKIYLNCPGESPKLMPMNYYPPKDAVSCDSLPMLA